MNSEYADKLATDPIRIFKACIKSISLPLGGEW